MNATEFINRWKDSGGAELANSQSFLKELCELLDVPQPEPTRPDESLNKYVFEKAVAFNNNDGTTSDGRADLYRRECFVLESKQGVERKEAEQAASLATTTKAKKFRVGPAKRGTATWEQVMVKARRQAKRYAEAIAEEWPPFLIVTDVGYCFDVYADFTQSGKNYIPFPDPQTYRIRLRELENAGIRDRLRTIWLDPISLDPSRRAAKITREVAQRLAQLAKSLENDHSPEDVAHFLMRCLFTMFAEDVQIGGLTKGQFTDFLKARRGKLKTFVPMLQRLWQEMDQGGFSVILEGQLKQFNGGLFEDHTALGVTDDQLELLIEAAEKEWNEVEPAIFGTLLERALDPVERHKLGAHYTPRAYVERLVMPTIIEPLREEWDTAYATAIALYEEGAEKQENAQREAERIHEAGKRDQANRLLRRTDREAKKLRDEAVSTLRTFHGHLCNVKVLDPACGSGNFLYVSLELMKRLEGEVVNALHSMGETALDQTFSIDPHQFLGIEVNPRAAAITDLVLWIGYLQWHLRTRGDNFREPIIRNFHNIEERDALLEWDAVEPAVDDDGKPVTRWDGRTTKPHPVTGEEVPDDNARVQELRYVNPGKAVWPKSDYIVGNPPFVGNFRMREALGDGYTETVRSTYAELPESCDYVMYWWHKAAELVRSGKAKRFGFIATNSLRQTFNRRVVALHLNAKAPLSIHFAIPDHPWVDSAVGAAVRISMTAGGPGEQSGRLLTVVREVEHSEAGAKVDFNLQEGKILQDLSIGADLTSTVSLQANRGLSCPGVKLHGAGFIVSHEKAVELGLGRIQGLENRIRPYRNGKDLTHRSRNVMVIDLFGLEAEDVREQFPEVYQYVFQRVKPERDQNNRKSYRDNWWKFGEPRSNFRPAQAGLHRYIATVETAKHRFFVFLDGSVLPDNMLIAVASEDAYLLGVLSSRVHVTWALAAGGRLGVGNDPRYNKTRCFEPFPFPSANAETSQHIRELGEQLDAHRKRQQELHPKLTMTGMYNVLELLRAAKQLSKKEQQIHEWGLVSVLRQIHDDLDAAVFDAYGWPHDLSDEEILQRLVDLNHERAAEEARGEIRWLRPEFQKPTEEPEKKQKELVPADSEKKAVAAAAKRKKEPWPKALPERVSAVRTAILQHAAPATAAEIARYFTRARRDGVEEILDTLVTVGQVRQTDDGRYVA